MTKDIPCRERKKCNKKKPNEHETTKLQAFSLKQLS